jgi:hypothetical protein
VLAAAIYTKHLAWSFVPATVCINSKVFVVDVDSREYFAALQSRVHDVWAWANSSTLKRDLAYSAQDAFQTFPFPFERGDHDAKLSDVGARLHDDRAQYMRDEGVGLTELYNRLRDPRVADARVAHLRTLHVNLDQAVLTAYGWRDVNVPKFACSSEAERNETRAFSETILERLSRLNADRASAEATADTSNRKTRRGRKPR